MRPLYSSLAAAFESSQSAPPAALCAEIGWDEPPAGADLCALRVSLALVKAGVRIPGRVNVSRGPLRGQRIEPVQTRLSLLLTHPTLLGRPEVYKGGALAEAGVKGRHGIVSYWCRDHGHHHQGHIDLVGPHAPGAQGCGTTCYRDADEIWFWPLP